jgi:protein HIRA/HIR1
LTDGYVRIWSTEAIYNSANAAYDGPKQLASMSYHSGTIHTVRFSPGGKFLASGADDKYVCIYTKDPNAPKHATFGSNEAPPVEHWPVFRRLIGHENDVQDLAWSYDGTVLVSVGLDSKIVVWSGYTFEKLKTISNHSSHVKGITFDPANKYFATASDDRTIKIFRFTPPTQNYSAHDAVNNFMLETTIQQPFVNSPLTTYFRRCSWSPDGMHIAAANAVNGPAPAIAIIDRGTWSGDTTLIGHEAAVEVCAFAPRLYGPSPEPQPTVDGHAPHHTTVIACGGGDKSFSIWTTQSPRPLGVAQEIAEKPISDIRWTPDGMIIFVTALDGTVLCIMFEPGELGYPQPIEENDRSLTKYGTSRKGQGFPETVDALLLEEMARAGEQKNLDARMGALMGDDQPSQTNGTKSSENTVNEPALNGNGAATNGASTPQNHNDQSQAKLERLKNRVEIVNGKKRIRPLLVSSAGGGESSLPQTRLVNAAQAVQNADAPTTILDLSKPFDGLPKGGLAALLLGNKRKYAQIEGEEEGTTEKRVAAASRNDRTPILANGPDGLVPAQPQPAINGQVSTPEFIRPAIVNPAMSVSQLRLAVPRVRATIVLGVNDSGKPVNPAADAGKSRAEYVFEIRNPSAQSLTQRAQDREPTRISLTKSGQPQWQDYLPRTVLLSTGNDSFWSVADENGGVYIWTPNGRRLNSVLVLDSQPVRLESYDSWLLCITSAGMCYVWNVATMSSPHAPVSLAPVLDAAVQSLAAHPTNAPAIHHVRLNSEGRIIISLSNGDGYAYSPQMYCWQKVSEVWWAVSSGYWNSIDSSVSKQATKTMQDGSKIDVSAGVIPWLERNTTTETLLRGRAQFLQRLIKVLQSREGFESFESGASLAHLENRLAAALMLGSKDEFRLYLNMYAKNLGSETLKLKAEELLRTLVGGIVDGEDNEELSEAAVKNAIEGRNWQESSKTLCGWPREELLKDVIMEFGKLRPLSSSYWRADKNTGKYRNLQRSIVPYAKMLNILEETNGLVEDVDM